MSTRTPVSELWTSVMRWCGVAKRLVLIPYRCMVWHVDSTCCTRASCMHMCISQTLSAMSNTLFLPLQHIYIKRHCHTQILVVLTWIDCAVSIRLQKADLRQNFCSNRCFSHEIHAITWLCTYVCSHEVHAIIAHLHHVLCHFIINHSRSLIYSMCRCGPKKLFKNLPLCCCERINE